MVSRFRGETWLVVALAALIAGCGTKRAPQAPPPPIAPAAVAGALPTRGDDRAAGTLGDLVDAERLVRLLGAESADVRRGAVEALWGMGGHAAGALVVGLVHPDPDVRAGVAALIFEMGERFPGPAISPLLELLKDHPSPAVRLAALLSLERVLPGDARIHGSVVKALEDPSPDVRMAARGILWINRNPGVALRLPGDVPWQVSAAFDPDRFAGGILAQMGTGQLRGGRWFHVPRPDPDVVMSHDVADLVRGIHEAPEPAEAGARLDALLARLNEEEVSALALWLAEARRAIDRGLGEQAPWPAGVAGLVEAARRSAHDVYVARSREQALVDWHVQRVLDRQAYVRGYELRSVRQRGDATVRLLHDALNLYGASVDVDSAVAWGGRMGSEVAAGVERSVRAAAEAVRENAEMLARGTARQRREALERLTLLGPLAGGAYPAVRRALKDEDSVVRGLAARALGRPDAAEIARRGDLVDALAAAEAPARVEAAKALAGTGDVKAIAGLVSAMGRDEWFVRDALAEAARRAWRIDSTLEAQVRRLAEEQPDDLRRLCAGLAAKIIAAGNADDVTIAPERAQVMRLLVSRIGGADARQAVEALQLLRELTADLSPAKAALAVAVMSADKELRYEATEAMVGFGQGGVDALVALLSRGDAQSQGLALVQLGRMGPAAKPAVPVILRLLELGRAAPELSVLGTGFGVTLSGVRQAAGVQILAADALRAIGPDAREAAGVLVAVAEDAGADDAVRGAARRALGRIAPGDERAVALRLSSGGVAEIELRMALEELRRNDPAARRRGVRRLVDSRALPAHVAAALERAVESGDFLSREGLVLGMERAWARGRPIEEVLRAAAASAGEPPENRTYARAALRALEVKP